MDNCTVGVAKTRVLISCADIAQLICAFFFAYAKIRFSHDVAHLKCLLASKILTAKLSSLTTRFWSYLIKGFKFCRKFFLKDKSVENYYYENMNAIYRDFFFFQL